MIRVIYHFRLRRDDVEAFRVVWSEVVAAHRAAGHASVESVLLEPQEAGEEEPGEEVRLVAISRWESRAAWEEQRRDDVAPEIYARFRALCEVEERQVFDELEHRVSEEALDPVELLARRFALSPEDADRLFEVTLWVDQEMATARYGYARDNAIPPPLSRRLLDPQYLARLYEALEDQEPELFGRLG